MPTKRSAASPAFQESGMLTEGVVPRFPMKGKALDTVPMMSDLFANNIENVLELRGILAHAEDSLAIVSVSFSLTVNPTFLLSSNTTVYQCTILNGLADAPHLRHLMDSSPIPFTLASGHSVPHAAHFFTNPSPHRCSIR